MAKKSKSTSAPAVTSKSSAVDIDDIFAQPSKNAVASGSGSGSGIAASSSDGKTKKKKKQIQAFIPDAEEKAVAVTEEPVKKKRKSAAVSQVEEVLDPEVAARQAAALAQVASEEKRVRAEKDLKKVKKVKKVDMDDEDFADSRGTGPSESQKASSS